MSRSHAHRAVAAALALGVLALAGCGSGAEQSPAAAEEPAASTGAAAPSASPTPSETKAATGIDDPATGIAGSSEKGKCTWVTGEQLAGLFPKATPGPVTGTLSQNRLTEGNGTIRRCLVPAGKVRLIIGAIRFDSAADLEAFVEDSSTQVRTPIADLPAPAGFEVYATPVGLSQSISVPDGTTLHYITAGVEGEKVKVVGGKNVPPTDRRPALRELYDAILG